MKIQDIIKSNLLWISPSKEGRSQGDGYPSIWADMDQPTGSFVSVRVPVGAIVFDIDDPSCELALRIGASHSFDVTAKTRTPNGLHVWYRMHDGIRLPNIVYAGGVSPLIGMGDGSDSTNLQSKNVDILTPMDSYVIVPPTCGYEFVGADLELLPDWLWEFYWDALKRGRKLYEVRR